ncbi:hypothetical protein [Roseibium sp.]|uniref:hypothetical protein n=1 Tax=Roseibium sp. TaxID=1936156 RepID=UPI003B50A031
MTYTTETLNDAIEMAADAITDGGHEHVVVATLTSQSGNGSKARPFGRVVRASPRDAVVEDLHALVDSLPRGDLSEVSFYRTTAGVGVPETGQNGVEISGEPFHGVARQAHMTSFTEVVADIDPPDDLKAPEDPEDPDVVEDWLTALREWQDRVMHQLKDFGEQYGIEFSYVMTSGRGLWVSLYVTDIEGFVQYKTLLRQLRRLLAEFKIEGKIDTAVSTPNTLMRLEGFINGRTGIRCERIILPGDDDEGEAPDYTVADLANAFGEPVAQPRRSVPRGEDSALGALSRVPAHAVCRARVVTSKSDGFHRVSNPLGKRLSTDVKAQMPSLRLCAVLGGDARYASCVEEVLPRNAGFLTAFGLWHCLLVALSGLRLQGFHRDRLPFERTPLLTKLQATLSLLVAMAILPKRLCSRTKLNSRLVIACTPNCCAAVRHYYD